MLVALVDSKGTSIRVRLEHNQLGLVQRLVELGEGGLLHVLQHPVEKVVLLAMRCP